MSICLHKRLKWSYFLPKLVWYEYRLSIYYCFVRERSTKGGKSIKLVSVSFCVYLSRLTNLTWIWSSNPFTDYKLGPLGQSDVSSDWYSYGCGFDSWIWPHTFWEIQSWNIFYSHSLPTADLSRAVVSYWQKYGHLVLVNHLGSLPRNSVDWLTDWLNITVVVDWGINDKTSI